MTSLLFLFFFSSISSYAYNYTIIVTSVSHSDLLYYHTVIFTARIDLITAIRSSRTLLPCNRLFTTFKSRHVLVGCTASIRRDKNERNGYTCPLPNRLPNAVFDELSPREARQNAFKERRSPVVVIQGSPLAFTRDK